MSVVVNPSSIFDSNVCIICTVFFFLQNANWADNYCGDKHGFICMKQSSSETSPVEVDVDIGCEAVSTCC